MIGTLKFFAILAWLFLMMLRSLADVVLLIVGLKKMPPVGEAVWRWRIS